MSCMFIMKSDLRAGLELSVWHLVRGAAGNVEEIF
jgi:hypothetical protein